jgi:hypothetical protein
MYVPKKQIMSSLTKTIPERVANLNSSCNVSYETLCDGHPNAPIEPNHDLAELVLHHSSTKLPDGLQKICIEIGCQRVIEIEVADIVIGEDILPCPVLPLSKAQYMITRLAFVFDKEYLRNREGIEWVDEVVEKEELSDNETEIFDGHEYHTGFRVHRKSIPVVRPGGPNNNNKVRRIICDVSIELPEIRVGFVKADDDFDLRPSYVDVWQKIEVSSTSQDAERIRDLVGKHGLRPCDASRTLDDAIRAGLPFWCYVKNCIRFQGGLAGLMYVFP